MSYQKSRVRSVIGESIGMMEDVWIAQENESIIGRDVQPAWKPEGFKPVTIGAVLMLENLSLSEMEAELKRTDDAIKRVFCSRAERENRDIKLSLLQQTREELTQGIKEIRSIPYSRIKARVGVLSPA